MLHAGISNIMLIRHTYVRLGTYGTCRRALGCSGLQEGAAYLACEVQLQVVCGRLCVCVHVCVCA